MNEFRSANCWGTLQVVRLDALQPQQSSIHSPHRSGSSQRNPKQKQPVFQTMSEAFDWGGAHESSQTLYVSQFRKKLTEPSSLLWITVQPPGSCLWSHHTCMRRLAFSGFTRYMPLALWPSSSACRQSFHGPGSKSKSHQNHAKTKYLDIWLHCIH